MAKAKGSLKNKVKKYVSKHKEDDTNYGNIDLPGGIHGVAQLSECKFNIFKSGTNEGEYFFQAIGIVKEPSEWVGARTMLRNIPVCETTNARGEVKSIDENISNIMNEMRKLGLDTSEYDDDDIEEMADDLKETKPLFKFSTTQSEPTKQYPNPRVWHNWHGNKGLEDYEVELDDGIEDETEVEEEEEEQKPKRRRSNAKKVKTEVEKEEEEDEVEDDDDDDLGDEDYDEDDDDDASDSESDDDDDSDDMDPDVGEMYYFKPPRARKAQEVEVQEVNKEKKTVDVTLQNGKIVKNVQWEKLSWD